MAVFGVYRKWLVARILTGCVSVDCAAEFPDPAHSVRQVFGQRKAGVRKKHVGPIAEAGAEVSEAFSGYPFAVLEGACAIAVPEDDERYFRRPRPLSAGLIYTIDGKAGA